MIIALRNTMFMASGNGLKPIFLKWLQSDGSTGYVDTGFIIQDPYTELQINASFSSGQSPQKPLVCSGTPTGIDGSDTTHVIYGFAAAYADRLLYFRTSLKSWWSNPYVGQWGDGNMHDISVRAASSTVCSASLDGVSVAMSQNVNTSLMGGPTDSQIIFASKFNGSIYLINNVYKVRRVAYYLNNNVLADFRAASVEEKYGFYDLIS